MRKKEYMTPTMDVVETEELMLLAGSGVSSDDIGYGGVDEGGTLDPASPDLEDILGLPDFLMY